MIREKNKALFMTLVAVMVLLMASAATAQGYKVERVSAAAPEELAAPIRETLAGEALRVSGPEGPLCEIWLRKAVPVRAAPLQVNGIAFGQLEDGTLMAAVRFLRDTTDYRRQKVKPGVFTLRYTVHPVDGNHLGIAPQRDFLAMVPAALDSGTAPIAYKELMDLSRKAVGAGHPCVWSLTEQPAAAGDLPTIVHIEEEDFWVVSFKIQLEGGASLAIGLVVVGHPAEA